jgi:predicted transposase/invertase (TIGR01784 family)
MERILPTSDLAFKKVLASEENKDILAGLIEDFFEIKAEDIVIEKPYSIAICKELIENEEVTKLRQTLKDVAASFKVADFVSEVQIKKTVFYEERALYYPFERFVQNYSKVETIKIGADGKPIRYSSLRPVYALNILGYTLFEEDDDTLRIFELYDSKRNKRFKELLRIGFFELGKTNIETANQKHWRDYFNTGEAKPEAPAYIKKASQIIEYVNLSEEERNVMTAMERLEANDQAEREYLVMESMAKGMEKGMEKGKIEIAKSMLEDGFQPEIVAKHTKLFLDDVMTIYKSVKGGKK